MTRNREFALIDNTTQEVTTSDSILELTDSILAGHGTETATAGWRCGMMPSRTARTRSKRLSSPMLVRRRWARTRLR